MAVPVLYRIKNKKKLKKHDDKDDDDGFKAKLYFSFKKNKTSNVQQMRHAFVQ